MEQLLAITKIGKELEEYQWIGKFNSILSQNLELDQEGDVKFISILP